MTTNQDDRQAVEYGDQRIERGQGGETHQVAAEGATRLTTQQGGYAGEPGPLFEAAGLTTLMDEGFISLDERSAADFITRCGQLRFWARQEEMVKAVV